MCKLVVVLYDNDANKGCNIKNLQLNSRRDSGLEPFEVLDQPSKDELLNYFSQ